MAKAKAVDNLGGGNHLLTLEVPGAPFSALGRFARLRAWPARGLGPGTLLDRPFSIHLTGPRELSFFIRQVGPATSLLASLSPGTPVRFIGPLGRGLDDLDPNFAAKSWYLVAGGAGLGPMPSIMAALGPRAKLFYGERSHKTQPDTGYLADLELYAPKAELVTATEDGSGYGQKGLVTVPLTECLKVQPRPIVACGPTPMLAALARLANQYSVPYFACVEARMACGLGVCLSCSLPKLDGTNFRVCREGPMVDGLAIDWDNVHT
ncbi:MAG: hypothetical protein LBJ61_06850 [Deltaproteobacteria bacterium]|jgi:dihydroorotate dehydrogenase electron transfer subunit|nr:hypothetical protein [Deltaproteobacteria bacterium]